MNHQMLGGMLLGFSVGGFAGYLFSAVIRSLQRYIVCVGSHPREGVRLRKALREVVTVTTWAGEWKDGCACNHHLPKIQAIAQAALENENAITTRR